MNGNIEQEMMRGIIKDALKDYKVPDNVYRDKAIKRTISDTMNKIEFWDMPVVKIDRSLFSQKELTYMIRIFNGLDYKATTVNGVLHVSERIRKGINNESEPSEIIDKCF